MIQASKPKISAFSWLATVTVNAERMNHSEMTSHDGFGKRY